MKKLATMCVMISMVGAIVAGCATAPKGPSEGVSANKAKDRKASDGNVGVFVGKKSILSGDVPALAPEKIKAILEAHGIVSELLDAEALAAPGGLTPKRFAVFVLPDGNVFPTAAREALRAYKAAGGFLVVNGVPSSRREQSDRQRAKLWDLPLIGHGPDGLGTGGGTAAFDATPYFLHYGFQSNPLGLGDDTLFSKDGTLRQALDVKTLHPDDEVIPLIGMIPLDNQSRCPLPPSCGTTAASSGAPWMSGWVKPRRRSIRHTSS